MNPVKILIADDEKDVLEVMRKKIARAGYEVAVAFDGEEAWKKIKSELPDVILLDLGMPKMDGFEVLKNLRQNQPSEKWQPVVIVSGRGELSEVKKHIVFQADHYITKPCDVDTILRAIRSMVGLIAQKKSVHEGVTP